MVHLLLLVSLFTDLNYPTSVGHSASASQSDHEKNSSFVEVRFEKVPTVTVGDPVLFNGEVVGSISKIDFNEDKKGNTSVSIRLQDRDLVSGSSFVALVGSVKTVNESGVKSKKSATSSRSFLELMALKNARERDSKDKSIIEVPYVRGFTSFQEFWASQSSI